MMKRILKWCVFLTVILTIVAVNIANLPSLIQNFQQQSSLPNPEDVSPPPSLNSDFSDDQYPAELIELMNRNPETESFVRNYPTKKDLHPEIDLKEYEDCDTVPLLLQWDERWGYEEYAGDLFGLTGCGPTCLSMVSIYLLHNTDYSPQYMAQFSQEHGYSVNGNGSSWTLISEGGPMLGLDVTEIPLDENRIIRNLEEGNPIICIMGPGDFTTSGHYIVMTGYTDGQIKVNDPNSISRSNTLWNYTDIESQIRNLWVCR